MRSVSNSRFGVARTGPLIALRNTDSMSLRIFLMIDSQHQLQDQAAHFEN